MAQQAILHVFTQRGCPHCLQAEQALSVWESGGGQEGVFIIRHRLDFFPDYEISGWRPRGTPAYALVSDGILYKTHEGVLTPSRITGFVRLDRLTVEVNGEMTLRGKRRGITETPEEDAEVEPA